MSSVAAGRLSGSLFNILKYMYTARLGTDPDCGAQWLNW